MLEWLANLFTVNRKPISKVEVGQGPASIKSTLMYMKKLVVETDKDRIVKETAKNIVKYVNPKDHMGQVKAITAWVKQNFKYTRDIYGVEELTDPVRILYSMRAGKNDYSSDCDDFATLIAALLRSIGFRTRLEALGVDSPYYNHARVSAWVVDRWVPIEGTRKDFPVGQALPSAIPIMYVEVM